MKRCHACGHELPLDEFPPNRARGDGRQSMCRPCYAKYQREYHRRRVRDDAEYFLEHPCADCGEDDHVVLTFDHVTGEKRFTIADRLYTMRWPRLLQEIAKCEVVCANCHMRRTARRAGYYLGLA